MSKPTDTEVAQAIVVLKRATGAGKSPTAAEALAMSDAELAAANIGPDELIRLAAATIPEAER
jgi:hypothetical protein